MTTHTHTSFEILPNEEFSPLLSSSLDFAAFIDRDSTYNRIGSAALFDSKQKTCQPSPAFSKATGSRALPMKARIARSQNAFPWEFRFITRTSQLPGKFFQS